MTFSVPRPESVLFSSLHSCAVLPSARKSGKSSLSTRYRTRSLKILSLAIMPIAAVWMPKDKGLSDPLDGRMLQ